jgi:hypothetical protein
MRKLFSYNFGRGKLTEKSAGRNKFAGIACPVEGQWLAGGVPGAEGFALNRAGL